MNKEGYYVHNVSIGNFETKKGRDKLKWIIIYNDYYGGGTNKSFTSARVH